MSDLQTRIDEISRLYAEKTGVKCSGLEHDEVNADGTTVKMALFQVDAPTWKAKVIIATPLILDVDALSLRLLHDMVIAYRVEKWELN